MPVSQEIFLSRYEQIMKSFGLKMGEKYLEKLRDGKAKPEFASSHNFDDFFGFPLNEKEYIALPNFKVVLDGSIPTKLKIHSVFEVKTEGGNYGVSSPAKFKVSGDDWALVTPGTITAIDDVSPGLFHEAKLAEDLIKEHISRLYGFIRSPADEPEVNLKEAIPIAEEMLGLIKGLKPGDFNLMDRARRLVEYYLDSNDVGMAEIVLMEIEKRIDERLVYKE